MKRAQPKRATPAEKLWLLSEFQELHREHHLILKRLDEMQSNVTPELEHQVRLAARLARKIDSQVPDES